MTACLDLAPHELLKDGTIACVNSTKGVKLRAAVFTAKGEKARGTICLFSGRTEFIEKYAQVIEELRSRGFCVAALDWRGQGGSSRELANPLKGHVGDFADYDADLKVFMQEVVLKSCPKPYVALSHSMGGLILLRAMVQNVSWFEKYIFSSPFWGLGKQEGLTKTAMRLLHSFGRADEYVPFSKDEAYFNMAFAGNPLTRDEAQFKAMMAFAKTRKDLYIGAPTVGWLYQAFQTFDKYRDLPPESYGTKPKLIFASGAEKIVSTPQIISLAPRMPNAKLHVIAEAEHEILMERPQIRTQFWQAFDTFMA